MPFKPTIAVSTQGGAVDSPEPTTVDVGIPFNPAEPIANSYLKTAKVTLPEGMGLNPASATGLVPCTDAQFAKGTNNPIACPAASVIGTVEVQTPSLPPNSLGGTVYVGEPLKNGPGAAASGEQFRIFIHATSTRYGVNVRLVGKVIPNLQTGQLTAIVEDNPQATFSNFRLHLNGGPKGTLTSPPTCGPNKTTTEMIPWSGHLDENEPKSEFNLTTYPGGGNCPKTLAERQVRTRLYREIGQQQSRRLQPVQSAHRASRWPAGAEGRQRDPAEGPDRQARRYPLLLGGGPRGGGRAAVAKPRPPPRAVRRQARSATTSTDVRLRLGPCRIAGKAYLAGPYKGAPFSMATITPGVAGPYDLGTVVVRVALERQPGNGSDQRSLRCHPRRVRRGEAGHPLDRRQRRPSEVHAQPDELRRAGDDRGDQRRRRQPGQPGVVQLLRR